MTSIDNSNLLHINKNYEHSAWSPSLKYIWDSVAQTITVTDESVVPVAATRKTMNLEVHDQYGKSVFGHMQSGGSGYSAAPAVTVAAPGGGGVTATATSIIRQGRVVGFNITNAGTLYTAAPTVTLAAPGGGGVTATATSVITNGTLTGIILTTPSSGAMDVSTLSVNKGLNISANITLSNGWVATGTAFNINSSAGGGHLQDWNISEQPASGDASTLQGNY